MCVCVSVQCVREVCVHGVTLQLVGPDLDSPEARTAALSLLRSLSSSCPTLPHNNSSNNSNGTADVGTQTGSVPSSPLTSHCQQEEEEEEKREIPGEEEETIQGTTWLGPGPMEVSDTFSKIYICLCCAAMNDFTNTMLY